MAECGKPGFLGGNFIDAKKSGLCKIREPQGSHLKKTSMLQEIGFRVNMGQINGGQTNGRAQRAQEDQGSTPSI
jgi:hypothetical protein